MSYRQERMALEWDRLIRLADTETARFALAWKIMEVEEERDRYKAAVAALDAALDRSS